jgi:hypothetical protein
MNGGSIYFRLARGGGLPSPHLQEVELGEADLLASVARGARCHALSHGAPQPRIWEVRGHRAGHDIGPWMRFTPWLSKLGRLRCQDLRAVDQR